MKVNHYLIKYKYKKIYIKYNSRRIIVIYIYLQEEIFMNISILTFAQGNIQKYMILFHSSVFINPKQHNVF